MIHSSWGRHYGVAMIDVFVSYTREDAGRVEPLVAYLRANGCAVWWDRDIAPGTAFEAEIEQAIVAAACVVIAITAHSANSDWVRAEAAAGQQHNKLIPVLLDDVPVPLSLRAMQVADLRRWPGESDAEAERLAKSIAARGPRGGRLFVGRDDAMRALQQKLTDAIDARGGVAMISGEPGIGKTRCAEEFARSAEDQGALVLWGRCYEQPGAPPYWPWVQILRNYAEASSDDELRMVVGRSSEVIAPLVPEIGDRIGVNGNGGAAADLTDNRFRLFDAISRILARAAGAVPLVLILDDVHWADGSSLALFEFLAHEIVRQRCLVVCTYRDVDVTRKSPLLATLGELTRSGAAERIRLVGLDIEQTGELAVRVSGLRIGRHVVKAIYHQTDGNPLFVQEVAQVLADEQRVSHANVIAIEVPDGIREAIGKRLDRLTDACNEILAVASVLGREFDLKIVANVLGRNVSDCLHDLDHAQSAGLVRRDGTASRYRFAHAVIRETLYEEIPTLERLQKHQAIGDAMVASSGDDLDPVLSEVAHHYGEASALGNHEKAVDFAMRAAERDVRVSAIEEAMRHYEEVVRVLTVNGRSDDRRVAVALLQKGRLGIPTMRVSEALDNLTRGIELARRLGDVDLLVDYVSTLVRLTSYGPQRHAALLVEEALRLLPADRTRSRALLLANLAFALRSKGDTGEVERTAREAIAQARAIEDPELLLKVLRLVDMALRGDAQTLAMRLEFGRQMVDLTVRCQDQEEVGEAFYWQALNLIECGDTTGFSRMLRRFAEHAENYGWPRHQYLAELLAGLSHLSRGEWTEAEMRIEHAYENGQRINAGDNRHQAEGTYGAQMFVLNRELGRLRAMAPLMRKVIEERRSNLWAPGLMIMCCEVDLLDQAREVFERLATNGFADLPRDDMWLVSIVYCAETCARLRDVERATQLYDLLLPFAEQTANHPSAVCFGSVATYLGMLADVMCDHERARCHFDRAIEFNRHMQAWPLVARTQLRLAQLLLRSESDDARQEGRRVLAEAEQIATRFEMAGLVAEIGERSNCGTIALPDGLTRREVDVLRLLAIGRSNKDISRVLSISLSTVATHVRSILTKSGCANRTEAAAYAMRHQIN